jgi:hypothetical protein
MALANWKTDPELFHNSLFDNKLWSKQIEIFKAVRDYPRVAVRSGNTIGKSRITAEIALWYLSCFHPSKVITTAPTFNQVENILWKEIATLYRKSKIPFGGKLLDTALEMDSDWFALGVSTDEVNRFQGFHSEHLLVLIDEALGVDPIIWEAIIGLHPEKVLAIGNPLEATGEFWNCFNSPLWHQIGVSCEECVEWQRKNGSIPGLVTRQWIEERRDEWGSKSALFQGRVLGVFPTEGTDLLIQPKWVEDARTRELEPEEEAMKIVASDVATKHGGNYTTLLFREGHDIKELESFQGLNAVMTAQKIKHKYEMKSADTVVVDSDGFGEGVADILINQHIGVQEFHGGYGSKAIDSIKFKNLRTQFYWMVAKKFEKGMYSLKNLDKKAYDLLKMQLCCIKAKAPDNLGRFQIETKDDLIARGIASPDSADSMVMAEFGYFVGKMGDIKAFSYR